MFYSEEQVNAISQSVVGKFLTLAAQAHFFDAQAARLAGVSRLTVHNWRKEAPTNLRVGALFNIMAASKWMEAGFEAGCLPARDKFAAQYYLDRLERGIKEWPRIDQAASASDGRKNAPTEGGEGTAEETAHHA